MAGERLSLYGWLERKISTSLMRVTSKGVNPNQLYWTDTDTRMVADAIKHHGERKAVKICPTCGMESPDKYQCSDDTRAKTAGVAELFANFYLFALKRIQSLWPETRVPEFARVLKTIILKDAMDILGARLGKNIRLEDLETISETERIELSQRIAKRIGKILDMAIYKKFRENQRADLKQETAGQEKIPECPPPPSPEQAPVGRKKSVKTTGKKGAEKKGPMNRDVSVVGLIGPEESVVDILILFVEQVEDWRAREVNPEIRCRILENCFVRGRAGGVEFDGEKMTLWDGFEVIHVLLEDENSGQRHDLVPSFLDAPKILGVFDLARALDPQFHAFTGIRPAIQFAICLNHYDVLAATDRARADAVVKDYEARIRDFFKQYGIGVTAFYLACPGAAGEYTKLNQAIVTLILDITSHPPPDEIPRIPYLFDEPETWPGETCTCPACLERRCKIGRNSSEDLGHVRLRNGDYYGAIEAYHKALESNPNNARAWTGIGDAYRSQNYPKAAVAAYENALESDPKYRNAWIGIGIAGVSQKDFKGGVQAYQRALEIDPNSLYGWYFLGCARSELNDPEGAAEAFNKALSINAQYVKEHPPVHPHFEVSLKLASAPAPAPGPAPKPPGPAMTVPPPNFPVLPEIEKPRKVPSKRRPKPSKSPVTGRQPPDILPPNTYRCSLCGKTFEYKSPAIWCWECTLAAIKPGPFMTVPPPTYPMLPEKTKKVVQVVTKKNGEKIGKIQAIYKVVVGGADGVGKATLFKPLSTRQFSENYRLTVGVNFSEIQIDRDTRFMLLTCSGQEHFKFVRQSWWKNPNPTVGIVMFDVTRKETFQKVGEWVEEARPTTANLFIIGNKIDLPNRQVSYEEGVALGKTLNVPYLEVSAKTRQGVGALLKEMGWTVSFPPSRI